MKTLRSHHKCVFCNEYHEIKPPKGIRIGKLIADYNSYRCGYYKIQEIMPYLDAKDREILKTGTCDKLFNFGLSESELREIEGV